LIYFKLQESKQGLSKDIKEKIIFKKQRMINYNMRFIFNIISMLFGSPFISTIEDKLTGIQKEFNKEGVLNDKTFYYYEDCYTSDLETFFKESDNLTRTNKSSFFYRSNLVNISTLFKCFDTRCIEKIMDESGFYHMFKTTISDVGIFDTIFSNFQIIKKKLIKLLLESYIEFDYNKIKELYIEYLIFHYDNFKMVSDLVRNDKKYHDDFHFIINIFKSTPIYVYLSCNMPSPENLYKFELTRILISGIGLKENEDSFINTIEFISHDLLPVPGHNQYFRKISYTDLEFNELREMFILLYKYYEDKQDKISYIINFIYNNFYEINIGNKDDVYKISIDILMKKIPSKIYLDIENFLNGRLKIYLFEILKNLDILGENDKVILMEFYNKLSNRESTASELYSEMNDKNKQIFNKLLLTVIPKNLSNFFIRGIKEFKYFYIDLTIRELTEDDMKIINLYLTIYKNLTDINIKGGCYLFLFLENKYNKTINTILKNNLIKIASEL
jgi:hypothetical protein